jgi:hypothetical protein
MSEIETVVFPSGKRHVVRPLGLDVLTLCGRAVRASRRDTARRLARQGNLFTSPEHAGRQYCKTCARSKKR